MFTMSGSSPYTKIHDQFFRQLMQDPENLPDFLKLLFGDAVAGLDFHSMKLEQDSFVDEKSREHYYDLLLSARDMQHRQRKIYILIEHKSYHKKSVYLDLGRYLMAVYQRQLDLPAEQRGPVLCGLLLQTQIKGKVKDIADLIELGPQEREQYASIIPEIPVHILDLHELDWDSLSYQVFMHSVLRIMHSIRSDDLPAVLRQVFELSRPMFLEQKKGLARFQSLLQYIMKAGRNITVRETIEIADTALAEPGKEVAMTIAEQLHKEGLEAGIQQGRQEAMTIAEQLHKEGLEAGIQQGRQEAMTIAEQLHKEGLEAGIQQGIQQGRQEAMAIAEQLRKEGLEEGIQKGIQKGMQKGEITGKLEAARNMLAEGEPLAKVMHYTGLSEADLKTHDLI